MSAYSYTLTNLLALTRTILQEETASFWTDSALTYNINEAIRTIAERSGGYRTTQSVSTVALTRMVSFTGYKCIAVEYNTKALIKITPVQAGHTKQDGIEPQYWFEYGNYIGIEPVPPTAYTLLLYVAKNTLDLSSGADIPLVPYSMCGLIPYFAASKAFEQDKKIGPAMLLMNMFYNELDYISQSLLPNVPV